MASKEFNIIILGAGPAGTTASLFLSKAKIPHILLDKAVFPRDKICGDALSGKVLPVLKKLNADLIPELLVNSKNTIGSHGILFAAPNGKNLEVPFKPVHSTFTHSPGFVSKRLDFDFSLVKLLDKNYCNFIQDIDVKKAERNADGIQLTASDNKTFYSPLLIACDGAHSIANKLFNGEHKMQPEHYCGGIRAYYKNVAGIHQQNFIELHFLKELLPGYFWIFPLPDGMTNVGAGMLTRSISNKKINLKEAMLKAIKENPTIRDRFKNAELVGKIDGWGLPLGSKKRKLSDDHILLCGDAASLIDPFSGEGISNAMYSGMIAAQIAEKCLQQNNFKSTVLAEYDHLVYKRLWTELKLSHTLQKLCNYPWLFNFVVNKANKNKTLRDTISAMFDDLDLRKKFRQPSFYFKLIFNK